MLRAAWTERVPRLSSHLVAVREVTLSDAPTLFDLLADPAVAEHLASPPPSVTAFAGFIGWSQDQRTQGNGVCFGIVPHGLEEAVGIIQVRALEPSLFAAEWGFAIGNAFWSTGVFVEAANLVADFAFTKMKVDRLEARVVNQNGRGHAVLQKLGARAEGTLARAFRKHGRVDKQLLWSLRHDDWRQRPLLHQRLSAAEAAEQIARAIQETRTFEANTRRHPVHRATPYPFFLTESKD